MKSIIKLIIKTCLVFIVAVVAFRYFSSEPGEFGFKSAGEGIGRGIKEITKVPGKIKESEAYQEIKQGVEEGYKDTGRPQGRDRGGRQSV